MTTQELLFAVTQNCNQWQYLNVERESRVRKFIFWFNLRTHKNLKERLEVMQNLELTLIIMVAETIPYPA